MHELWSTLKNVTVVKRQELAKKWDACRKLRSELVASVEGETDERERLRLLLRDAGRRMEGAADSTKRRAKRPSDLVPHKASAQHEEILTLAGLSALNIQRFLQQSQQDASIPRTLFGDYEKKFWVALEALETKYQYATLFSDLVMDKYTAETARTSAFEAVGRQEMHEQQAEWESIVFAPSSAEEFAILSALEKVFHTPEAIDNLVKLRDAIEIVCRNLQEEEIDVPHMKVLVNGVIASDLLSEEQTAVLKQVRNSPTWLGEMVDVLNLQLRTIESWSWETDAVVLELRRQLNGKYRFYMQEEVTQALLMHHIGLQFSSAFARIGDVFLNSFGWKRYSGVDQADQAKWRYFIGKREPTYTSKSVETESWKRYRSDYFLSILPRSNNEGLGGYGDDALQDGKQQSRVAKTVEAKQSLFHRLVAEGLIADGLEQDLVVVQTDFRWFGPSLGHATIGAVMKFLGVTSVWRSLFAKFLQVPLRFESDGPNGPIRRRERGVPMSHSLSSFFGEATLFCLDFAVNDATGGKPMFRMHDDICMWGTAKEMESAWTALTSLSNTMGIALNEEKTGAARLTRNQGLAAKPLPDALPSGVLRWGLLTLAKDGHFRIDQGKVDEHISELKRQLRSRDTVMAWIKAYNIYMEFFALHFCEPANALGRAHVDDCLSTLRRVNLELCPSTEGNVALYVKGMISERFAANQIPDGFLFFPMGVGGLELRNPMIRLQGMLETVPENPYSILEEALDEEQVEYRRLQDAFKRMGASDEQALADKPTQFMSEQDFGLFRREYNGPFFRAWKELQLPATMEDLELTTDVETLISKLGKQQAKELLEHTTQPYWRNVLEIYGPEMADRYGGLLLIERGLLPIGMVELLRSKIRWDV